MRRLSTGPHDPLVPIESIAYASRRGTGNARPCNFGHAAAVDVQAGVPMSAQYSCSAVLTSERRSSTGSSLYESAVRRIESSGLPSGMPRSCAVSASARVARRRSRVRDDRQPECVLVQVVDRRRTVGELLLGQAGEARRRKDEVIDDRRMTIQVQQVPDPHHRVTGGDMQLLRLGAVRLAARERDQPHLGVFLRAVFGDDMEEVEQQPVAIVACDESSAALLADQQVGRDELVDGLAHGADRHVEPARQPSLGGDGFARLPFALRERVAHLAGDLPVERDGERDAGQVGIGHRRDARYAIVIPRAQGLKRCRVEPGSRSSGAGSAGRRREPKSSRQLIQMI